MYHCSLCRHTENTHYHIQGVAKPDNANDIPALHGWPLVNAFGFCAGFRLTSRLIVNNSILPSFGTKCEIILFFDGSVRIKIYLTSQ